MGHYTLPENAISESILDPGSTWHLHVQSLDYRYSQVWSCSPSQESLMPSGYSVRDGSSSCLSLVSIKQPSPYH